MHEFSIGESLVESINAELDKLAPRPTKLVKASVVIGGLHQIIPEYLTTAYDVLTKDTPLAGSHMEIVVLPVQARCESCSWEGEIEPPNFICPQCASFRIEVTSGRELYLDHLEVEDADDETDQGLPGPDGRQREVGAAHA